MTEREIKKVQEEKLFDLLIMRATPQEQREELLKNQIVRAKTGMTAEEVSHVIALVNEAMGK